MLALIDGDIVAHRVGWTTENDDFPIARFRVDEMLDGILLDTCATEFSIFLSDRAENNFRYKIYPEYKANRAKLPRPRHLEAIKEYLITKWSASIALEQEADDALGIEQCRMRGKGTLSTTDSNWNAKIHNENPTVICTIDKDLQQIPGRHYNFVKKEHTVVSIKDGLQHFYRQILVGDTADNISGCKGIGPVKADRILSATGGVNETMALAVFNTYCKAFEVVESNQKAREEIRAYIEKIGQVLKIRQQEDEELWVFPLQNLTAESPLQYTPKVQEGTGQSTEPTLQEKECGFQ